MVPKLLQSSGANEFSEGTKVTFFVIKELEFLRPNKKPMGRADHKLYCLPSAKEGCFIRKNKLNFLQFPVIKFPFKIAYWLLRHTHRF